LKAQVNNRKHGFFRFPVGLFGLCFLASSAAAQVPTPVQPEPQRITGSFRTIFDLEQDEISGTDLDLANYLRLDVRPFLGERTLFHFYGRLRFDLDHESTEDKALKNSNQCIFQAFLELHQSPRPLDIRLGRQWVPEVDGAYLDGGRLDFPLGHDLGVILFGGRPASPYSSGDHQYLAGGRLSFTPFKSTTFWLSGLRSDEGDPNSNDQIGFHINQNIWRVCNLYGDYKFLNNRSKALRIGGNGVIQPFQLELRGSYYNRINRTPTPKRDDVDGRYFSDYFLLLNSVEELDSYTFNATKYLGESLAVTAGIAVTRIRGEENPTNRDSEHYFFSLQLFDLFMKRLTFSVDVNCARARLSNRSKTLFKDLDGSEEEITTIIKQDDQTFFITGQVDYSFPIGLKAAVGSAYGDFDFDRSMESNQPVLETLPRSFLATADGDRFITRTYFVDLDYKFNKSWSSKLLLEYNHSKINTGSDPGDYGRIVSSILYRF
jgi:hypothetical protein